MRQALTVHGAGISALAASRVARDLGWCVERVTRVEALPPIWVLSQPTYALLKRIFGPEALRCGHRLQYHRVIWGGAENCRSLNAWVVCGNELCRSLNDECDTIDGNNCTAWAIDTLPPPAPRISFGKRMAVVARFALLDPNASATSHIESQSDGWMFFAPTARDEGIVQVTALPKEIHEPDMLLARYISRSKHLRTVLGQPLSKAILFKAAGHAQLPLVHANTFRCGSAALRVDPLCGDGVGYAVRSAIWAMASLDQAARELNPKQIEDVYTWRIQTTLRAHLRAVANFYAGANFSLAWGNEHAIIAKARSDLETDTVQSPFLDANGDRMSVLVSSELSRSDTPRVGQL